MRMSLRVMFAFALLCSFAQVAMGEEKCATSELCNAYHNGQTPLRPAIPDMICVTFVQAGTDTVVLSFYDEYDPSKPNSSSNHVIRRYEKVAGQNGKFCVGKQWFDQAEWIMICNGQNYYDLRVSYVQDQIDSRTVYTCLLGSSVCPALQ